MKRKDKVFVGMSGGVDSSVTALLLKKKGYDVVGVFMRSYNIDGCAETDAEDARRVAGKLGIPFYVWDFEEEYKKKVVDYMVEGYRKGLTPNPDVMCNKEIKFGLFLEKALKFGADYVATGHYVRIKKTGGRFSLYAAKDKNKDQSYFLWTLNQKQLKHCLFPIGDYQKSEVRAIAKKAGLSTAEKKDSQGICFLGRVKLDDFLTQYIKPKTGQVRLALKDGSYKVIGKHSGAHFFTIGQRHGLTSGDWKRTPGASKPFYVAEKNVRKNTIVVAEGEDDESLFRKEIEFIDVNFINPQHSHILENVRMSVMARVRYRQPLVKATLVPVTENKISINQRNRHPSVYRIIFNNPIKFVAAGQSAVFYSKTGEMLGGGIIL